MPAPTLGPAGRPLPLQGGNRGTGSSPLWPHTPAPRPWAPHIDTVQSPRPSPEEQPVGSGGCRSPTDISPSLRSPALPPGPTLTGAPGAGQASALLPGQAGATPHSGGTGQGAPGQPDCLGRREQSLGAHPRGHGGVGVSRDPLAPAQHPPKWLPFRGAKGQF